MYDTATQPYNARLYKSRKTYTSTRGQDKNTPKHRGTLDDSCLKFQSLQLNLYKINTTRLDNVTTRGNISHRKIQ